ncbi:MAG: hypothetical protein ACRCVT_15550 [Leadbetterella sp.]
MKIMFDYVNCKLELIALCDDLITLVPDTYKKYWESLKSSVEFAAPETSTFWWSEAENMLNRCVLLSNSVLDAVWMVWNSRMANVNKISNV